VDDYVFIYGTCFLDKIIFLPMGGRGEKKKKETAESEKTMTELKECICNTLIDNGLVLRLYNQLLQINMKKENPNKN
jgi:hypothetical protein